MTEYLAPDSLFLTNDSRHKRWAIPYHHEALNARADILLGQNVDCIRGKKILDLGCHFGTFSYIAHQLGASHITGIDSDAKLIQQAGDFFSHYQVKSTSFTFKVSDIENYLLSLEPKSFDTVFCFGLLYYLPDNYHILQLIKRIAKEAIILDTFTAYYCAVQGKDSAQVIKSSTSETFQLPLMFHNLTQTEKTNYSLETRLDKRKVPLTFINCPTISLLELYFESLGFDYQKLEWSTFLKNPHKTWQELLTPASKLASHWSDVYSSNIRVSYLLKVN